MKKSVLSLLLSLILVMGLAAAVQAGDFVLSLDYQDLGSNLGIGDLADWKGSGNSYSLDGQYYFTPQCSLELAYAHSSFSHDLLGLVGIDYAANTYNLQLNYLFPVSDKFSFGGFIGYKSYGLGGDGWIDFLGYSGSLDNLYNLKMSGVTIGLKMAYKPSDQFTLEASYGEIVSPSMDLKILDYKIPNQYFDNEYYRQFDITGSYWITPSFALRAGYSKIWTGFEVPLISSVIDGLDRTYDGLHVGLAWKF